MAEVFIKPINSETKQCEPTVEVCSDGVDGDCDGYDPKCQGVEDADMDGFEIDCDDHNRDIYPGRYAKCSDNCGYGLKQCLPSGSYGACSCNTLCEAKGSGRCYYISASSGSNSNSGSFESPWKDFSNISSPASPSVRPENFTELKPGDVVYLLGGVQKTKESNPEDNAVLKLWSVFGTQEAPITIKAYPGTKSTLDPQTKTDAIFMVNSENIHFEGFEITGAYGNGIFVINSKNIKINGMRIFNNDGIDNYNSSGVYVVGTENVEIANNYIYDNYDRQAEDTGGVTSENSRNLSLFKGGNIHVHNNVIFQSKPITADKTGACLVYKHSQSLEDGVFEANNNILWNCKYDSIGTGTQNSNIHHNLIVNSEVLRIRNFGGDTNLNQIEVYNNTFINSRGLSITPTDEYFPIGQISFTDNIVLDSASYGYERNLIDVGTYSPDRYYDDIMSNNKLLIDGNCYYNYPDLELKFGFFEESSWDNLWKGKAHSFSSWQEIGFDTDSFKINPEFHSSEFKTNVIECNYKGWR